MNAGKEGSAMLGLERQSICISCECWNYRSTHLLLVDFRQSPAGRIPDFPVCAVCVFVVFLVWKPLWVGFTGRIGHFGVPIPILRQNNLPIAGEHFVSLRPMLSTDFRDKETDLMVSRLK